MGNRKNVWNPVLRPDMREEVSERTKPRWLVLRDAFVNAAEGVVAYRNDPKKQQEAFIALLDAASKLPVSGEDNKNERMAALAYVRNRACRAEIHESKDRDNAFDVLYAAACAIFQANGNDDRASRGLAGSQVRGTRAFARTLRSLGNRDSFLKKHGLISDDSDEGYVPSVSRGNVAKLLEALEKDGNFVALNRLRDYLPPSWLPREEKKPDSVDTLTKTFVSKGMSKRQKEPETPAKK